MVDALNKTDNQILDLLTTVIYDVMSIARSDWPVNETASLLEGCYSKYPTFAMCVYIFRKVSEYSLSPRNVTFRGETAVDITRAYPPQQWQDRFMSLVAENQYSVASGDVDFMRGMEVSDLACLKRQIAPGSKAEEPCSVTVPMPEPEQKKALEVLDSMEQFSEWNFVLQHSKPPLRPLADPVAKEIILYPDNRKLFILLTSGTSVEVKVAAVNTAADDVGGSVGMPRNYYDIILDRVTNSVEGERIEVGYDVLHRSAISDEQQSTAVPLPLAISDAHQNH
jgi:hypothetical protein